MVSVHFDRGTPEASTEAGVEKMPKKIRPVDPRPQLPDSEAFGAVDKVFADIGFEDFSVSDDALHYGEAEENLAKDAVKAAREAGLPIGTITSDRKPSWKSRKAITTK